MAESVKAKIVYRDLHALHPQLEAYCKPPYIYLDYTLPHRYRDFRCALAHELGHIFYPPMPGHVAFHTAEYIDADCIERGRGNLLVAKDERMAWQFATNALLPDEVFLELAKSGPHELQVWLDEFDVTWELLQAKVGLLQMRKNFRWSRILCRIGS